MADKPTYRLIVIFMIASLIVSTPLSVTHVAAQSEEDAGKWLEWAKIAWGYFEPGVGLSPETGIPRASRRFIGVTDWDLGGYIIAIICAELMGIIPKEGPLGADDRIEKVLHFLETRDLTPYRLPARLYDPETLDPKGDEITNVSDSGRLLIALHLLKKYRPDLAKRIDNIVARADYARLADNHAAWRTTAGFYKYYVAHGFKFFGFDKYYPVEKALKTFEEIKKGKHIDVYGVSLPVTEITSEPILHTVFELDPSEDFTEYAYRVYLVQERRYNVTGKFTAWSEGNTRLLDPSYVYEWIVTPSGKTWVITPDQITPIIFTRAAFGLHAIYDTPYTRALVKYVEERVGPQSPVRRSLSFVGFLEDKGLLEGVREDGSIVQDLVANTQTMIIEAAYYAFRKRVMTSANLMFEKPSDELRPGEEARLSFEYLDPTPLKHTCNITITLENAAASYVTQYDFNGVCNATVSWVPPKEGVYRVTVKLVADYLLFNKTMTRIFDVEVGSASVRRDAWIVEVLSPDRVGPGEEFNVTALVKYDFGDSSTLLKLLVEDEGGEVMAETGAINASGSGSVKLAAKVKAPDEEGNLTIMLVPAYRNETGWIELDERSVNLSVVVERFQQAQTLTEKTVVKKQIVFMTITRAMTIRERVLTTYTVTQTTFSSNIRETLMPTAILVCSLCLLVIAVIAFLSGKRVKRSREPEYVEEAYW